MNSHPRVCLAEPDELPSLGANFLLLLLLLGQTLTMAMLDIPRVIRV